jgi:hypothetical protein
LPDQRAGIGGIAALAVVGDLLRLRREAHERTHAAADGGKPASDVEGARAHGSGEAARERIVAAGIEEEDAGLCAALHRALHRLQAYHLHVERRDARQLRIDGDQIVLARYQQSVPGVEEHRRPGGLESSGEVADGLVESGLVEIEGLDDVKAEPCQGGADVDGIVSRVFEPRGVPIGGIADHEGDALLRHGTGRAIRADTGRSGEEDYHGEDDDCRKLRAAGEKPSHVTAATASGRLLQRLERDIDDPGPAAGGAPHRFGERNAHGLLHGIGKRRVLTHRANSLTWRQATRPAEQPARKTTPPRPGTALRASRTNI